MHTIQIQKTIPVTNGGDTTTVKTNYCGHLTYTIGYAPINVKPQRGGGAYMGDLIDLCLPALGNLILIFVPRVGIFEFSDQE
jgi:hypothetical protein